MTTAATAYRPATVVLLAVTVAAVATHLWFDDQTVSFVAMVVVALATVASVVVGLSWYRPAASAVWYWGIACSVLFLCGIAMRDTLPANLALLSDVFTLGGYACLSVAAVQWLRPWANGHRADLMLDTLTIGLGALLAAWTLLIAPALQLTDDHDLHSVIGAFYPAIDAVLFACIVHAVFTTARLHPSLTIVQFALVAIVIGDLGYALNTAGITALGTNVLLVPFFLGYSAVGAAALQPSMRNLAAPRRQTTERSRQRAVVIAVVLVLASFGSMIGSDLDRAERAVVYLLLLLLLLAVLARSERAILRSNRSERRARYRAAHDTLTGLPNRTALLEDLTLASTPAQTRHPLSVMFIDLDGFKLVNDKYGHSAGDELIACAAARVRGVLRRDDIAARYGGDEFVVAARLGRRDAQTLATRLLESLTEPFHLECGRIAISASVGIACTDDDTHDKPLAVLISEADHAMYTAKVAGPGSFAFYTPRASSTDNAVDPAEV